MVSAQEDHYWEFIAVVSAEKDPYWEFITVVSAEEDHYWESITVVSFGQASPAIVGRRKLLVIGSYNTVR